jgi:protein TonB
LPKFYAGGLSFDEFVQKNMQYPEYAKKHNIGGRVVVGFRISAGGMISNTIIISGSAVSMNEEALRIVNLAPFWLPET